jgi:signal transduction histidine kinase
MECTVNDVLDFRKLDANLFLMSVKPVHVAPLMEGICKHCRPLLLGSVGLQFRVQPPDARALLDPRRLHQILINGIRWGSRMVNTSA